MENKPTVGSAEELSLEYVNRVVTILQLLKDNDSGAELNGLGRKLIINSEIALELFMFSLQKGWSADELVDAARTIIALHLNKILL